MPARGSNRAYLRARAHTALASPGVCEHLLDTSPTRFTALGVAGVAGGARSSSRSLRVRIRTTVADRTTAADRSTAQPPRPPPPPSAHDARASSTQPAVHCGAGRLCTSAPRSRSPSPSKPTWAQPASTPKEMDLLCVCSARYLLAAALRLPASSCRKDLARRLAYACLLGEHAERPVAAKAVGEMLHAWVALLRRVRACVRERSVRLVPQSDSCVQGFLVETRELHPRKCVSHGWVNRKGCSRNGWI